MPKRRAPGWAAANFVLPRRIIEGLTLLTKSIAERERAERSSQPYGFRRRYPKTKNYFVVKALNYLLKENGLSQFCVEETEATPAAFGSGTRVSGIGNFHCATTVTLGTLPSFPSRIESFANIN
jgi:hypothetical protein